MSDTPEDNSERSEELRRFYEDELVREAHRRRFLYSDVESLLTQGFLTHTLVVKDTTLTLRSLTDDTASRLRQRLHRKLTVLEWQRLLLAASTHAVGYLGLNMEDPNAEYLLYRDLYSEFPTPYVAALHSVLDGFSRRVTRALALVEAYCYEPYSRSLWRGVVGTTPPAYNAVYRVWRAFNLAEDERTADFMQWEHTRMFVSSMSSKGAKHLLNEEKKLKQREQSRRNSVIEQQVTRILSGSQAAEERVVTVTLDGETFEVPRIMSAHTADELMGEMERAARGERDYHDKVVERYKDGIRSRVETERSHRQEAFDKALAMARAESQEEQQAAPLVGYTPEQLREIGPAAFAPRRQTADTSHSARLYDRYMQTAAPKVGWVGLKGVPEPATPPTVHTGGEGEAPPPSPLQQAVAARKPTVKP